jgi:hypothetical protein
MFLPANNALFIRSGLNYFHVNIITELNIECISVIHVLCVSIRPRPPCFGLWIIVMVFKMYLYAFDCKNQRNRLIKFHKIIVFLNGLFFYWIWVCNVRIFDYVKLTNTALFSALNKNKLCQNVILILNKRAPSNQAMTVSIYATLFSAFSFHSYTHTNTEVHL